MRNKQRKADFLRAAPADSCLLHKKLKADLRKTTRITIFVRK